jgi:hypothetical protein
MKLRSSHERAKHAVDADRYRETIWTHRAPYTIVIRMSLICSPLPTIATFPGPYMARRSRALHFFFIQAGLGQDSLDLFQDWLVRAVVLFCERKAIAPQKFSPVVAALARLLSPVLTYDVEKNCY